MRDDGSPALTDWHGAAGALLFDAQHRLLCVKPTYRDGWLVPGGVIEPGERPVEACRREVAEELGLAVPIGRLLCVEVHESARSRQLAVKYLFVGGVLSEAHVAAIRLPPAELAAHRFLVVESAIGLLVARLARRVECALAALQDGTTVLLRDDPDSTRLSAPDVAAWLIGPPGGAESRSAGP